MTFSEYITRHALQEYMEYCNQKNFLPKIDVRIYTKPVCALLKTPVTQ